MWDKFLHLRQNIHLGHSEADNQHAQWLLEIGAGSTMDDSEMIQVSQSMVCANINALINRIYPGISTSWIALFSVLEMMKCMILMRPFFNSSTQMQRSICWEVWTLCLKKMECTMLILQSFLNNSMLVDCLLLCFVSRLALQLSY